MDHINLYQLKDILTLEIVILILTLGTWRMQCFSTVTVPSDSIGKTGRRRDSYDIAAYEVEGGCAMDKALITVIFLHLILRDLSWCCNELYHSELNYRTWLYGGNSTFLLIIENMLCIYI